MSKYTPKNIPYEDIIIARQPIFTRMNDVWGFELLYRSAQEDRQTHYQDANLASMVVSTCGFLQQANIVGSNQRVSINYTPQLIMDLAPQGMPADLVVIEVIDALPGNQELFVALARLKADGYTIAIDDYSRELEEDPIVSLADMVKIDVLSIGENEMESTLRHIPNKGIKTVAKRVDSLERHTLCHDLGFDLFQGYYYAMPHNISGRKLPANVVSKTNLLQQINKHNEDIDKIVELLKTDPGTGYRLLRYINSPIFKLASEVDTLHRAASLLGTKPLCRWLGMLLLSDLAPKQKTTELYRRSLERAGFFRSICSQGCVDIDAESCFTFGLLSLLDALLDMDMVEISKQLPLSQELKDGFVDQDTPLHQYLKLIQLLEQGQVESAGAQCADLNVAVEVISKSYLEATVRADEIFAAMHS